MFDFINHIKLIIGIISSVMLVLSAFRYEVIDREEYNSELARENQQRQQQQAFFNNNNNSPLINFTIDKQSLDALAKFDRNVRHLQIKGKEASRSDFSAIVPDFREAISAATKVLHELHQLKLSNNYYSKDGSRKSYKKRTTNGSFVKKDKKTLVFSIPFGSKVYTISLYWPKLLRLIIGDTDND